MSPNPCPDTQEELEITHAMRLVQRTCRRMLVHKQDAEDASQAVFLLYWRKRRSLLDHPNILAWFQRSAVLVCKESHRKNRSRRREQTLLDAAVTDPPDKRAIDSEQLRIIEEALAKLPHRQAEVLHRMYFLEQNQADIAKSLKSPVGSVASWAKRGREKLEQILTRRGYALSMALVLPELGRKATESTQPGSAPISTQANLLAEAVVRHLAWAKVKLGGIVLATTCALFAVGFASADAEEGTPAVELPTQEKTELVGPRIATLAIHEVYQQAKAILAKSQLLQQQAKEATATIQSITDAESKEQMFEQLRNKLEKREMALLKQTYSLIRSHLEDYAEAEGYDLVLQVEPEEIRSRTLSEFRADILARTVLISKGAPDITEDFIRHLNEQEPKILHLLEANQ